MDHSELKLRRDKIRALMAQQNVDAALIACNVDLLYTVGRVVSGYLYLPVDASAHIFLKRPDMPDGERVHRLRKPEQLPEMLNALGFAMPRRLMLESDELSHTDYLRLAACFPKAQIVNGTPLIRQARSVKTRYEIELFRRSGILHARAYNRIPSVYRAGMTDRDLSIEIERIMRQEGCLGLFRTFGQSMEIFMGSVLTGDNAATPSPYDFALGGEGLHPSLPVGANGTPLRDGQTVMVDIGGNFYGYMSDMSRTYTIGKLSPEAYDAHQVCLAIEEDMMRHAAPGYACEALYENALLIAEQQGYADRFMGTTRHAGFVGHGIGLQINELPVLAPRTKQTLEEGMVFAFEPKIIVPGVGPVGIENSWVVTADGVEQLTPGSGGLVALG
ncbi:MAG: Xaa-Pro peptidase family protein [Prevotellaceae bacterium]|nr:Xaa-Pro peptidase family protein [Prevotellaceae bacterium]